MRVCQRDRERERKDIKRKRISKEIECKRTHNCNINKCTTYVLKKQWVCLCYAYVYKWCTTHDLYMLVADTTLLIFQLSWWNFVPVYWFYFLCASSSSFSSSFSFFHFYCLRFAHICFDFVLISIFNNRHHTIANPTRVNDGTISFHFFCVTIHLCVKWKSTI